MTSWTMSAAKGTDGDATRDCGYLRATAPGSGCENQAWEGRRGEAVRVVRRVPEDAPRRRFAAVRSAAAGVVAARTARVARAGPLHHPAALFTRRPQIEALQLGRNHRRLVRHRRRRRLRRGC